MFMVFVKEAKRPQQINFLFLFHTARPRRGGERERERKGREREEGEERGERGGRRKGREGREKKGEREEGEQRRERGGRTKAREKRENKGEREEGEQRGRDRKEREEGGWGERGGEGWVGGVNCVKRAVAYRCPINHGPVHIQRSMDVLCAC